MRIKPILTALMCSIAGTAAAAPPGSADRGLQLFAITCSSSFCHGDGGVGARGPSLHNRDFTADFVRTTVTNGRSGTPMPSFKDILKPDELADVVAYVMSLSPNNQSADTAAAAPTESPSVPVPISEQAERGKALFFDQARPAGCSFCHSYQGEGGPVGQDLIVVSKEPARSLYEDIAPSSETSVVIFTATKTPAITVTTRDGQSFTGTRAAETDQFVRLYDLSSIPPVLRTFYKADGIKVAVSGSNGKVHNLSGYSKDDLADIIAFLQSATGEGKKVSPQDFAQQEKP
jgi:mono/diheme cytochrome c family protein